MGFHEVQSGEGYTKFSKGANLYITPENITDDEDEYQGNTYQQLIFTFEAVPEGGGEQGRVPAWLSSKITIRESEEHTSALGKFLQAAGILEDVLESLGATPELIQDIKEGDQRYEAESPDENRALLEAVAKHLDGDIVLRVGSKWNSKNDYSVVKDFYERVDENPFAAADESDESDSEESEPVLAE